MASSGEARFIDMMRALARDPAARALTDDVAVLPFGTETLVVTHDMMAQGVHWLAGQDEADIAWKLVATNLSDLAAKGARPVGVLIGYALGPDDARFAQGLREVLDTYDVPLLGGDTITPPAGGRSHGLTALGRATHVPVPARNGAHVGDSVWITGPVGAAMLGFEALRDHRSDIDTTAFRRPVPRLAEGIALAPLVTAMMDVSDGLLIDARRLAEASGVCIALESAAVPVPETLPPERLREALGWGDDYQLLFTLPPGVRPPIDAYAIGRVTESGPYSLLLDGAPPQGRLGYWHDRPNH
ncbi:thiamine-monophosphate kinase [Novosphingobium nitrogenifigens DSM 19370]|uniref:Thiamine-monophosphate kinase n=1 Tax=Novosphingobium nitrogenifigens DSM 19370 TaxID=983920 RepID=F1ZDG9_9SPHN|nr:thiamine-phosphate kinase [Novosphingobium nitrogenifigens]EGD57290.1 thiamine-monophosphate kinase [Novosphingobium nitrogenifigens DSM 19370]